MSKLRSVVRHEYLTVVKQKGFWAYMIIMPLIFLLVFILIGIGGRSDNTSLEKVTEELKGVAVVDASGLVSPDIIAASGQTQYPVDEFDALHAEVESGERKGLIYYPANLLETRQYQTYVSGVDFIFSTSLSEVGGALLRTSLYLPIGSEEKITLAQTGAESVTTTYANGTTSVGFARFIVPGAIAAMFIIILMFSIGYILTSISDEKENRSMEMALTYLSPRTLIVGKLISVVLITITQLLFFALVGILTFTIAVQTNFIDLPANFDLTALPVDPVSVLFGLAFLVVGFVLFAAFMALIAVLFPAKQANNFSALFYILPFVPTWFIWTVLTDPSNSVVQFITYFPITAPTTSMIRNTVGNIPASEALLSLGIMAVTALVVLWIVVKVFPKGALEFQNALSLKTIFAKKR
jgi:ABC-2 type transport system permease protein